MLNSGAIMSCAMLLSLVKPVRYIFLILLVKLCTTIVFVKKCVKNSIIFQEMKISEKFDFVMEYLKKIGGGEFMRYVRLNIFFSKKNEITI